jgi:L,D-transpeptidase catalytic domain
MLLYAAAGAVVTESARAQDETATGDGAWTDPTADTQWTDISDSVDQSISDSVDQTISDAWNAAPDGDDGGDWVDPAPVDPAVPSYDANGNLIDPNTGAPLAIGADGAPIDAAAGLYFDDQGNLIDPATGMAISYDDNGQPIVPSPASSDTGTVAADTSDASVDAEPELVTTPWLAPPPSGPPPGFANWSPPSTVYIPETGQSIDGVFLDSWRAWGGAASWGLPLTQEFNEDGHVVQYYDFGRFEYHPDDPDGVVVQFGDLGRQLRPFMVRREAGTGSAAANEAALTALAWAPIDAGDRTDSESWRYVPETGHAVAGGFKGFWESTGEVGYLGNPLTEPFKIDGTTFQVFERGELSQKAGSDPTMLPVGKMMVERLKLDTTPIAQGDIPTYSEDLFVAPVASITGGPVDPNGEKWVQISISLQYLWAYQGDQVLWQGYISTGRAGFQTPTGEFHVLSKLPSQTMEGVLGGEYYNVPDVPDVMYFTDFGHALHGTYWHNSFGTPMSHGCVNLPMDVAAWMYQWAPVGMRVEIEP